MMTRTGFPTAVRKTLEVLKTGEPFTQSRLAEKAGMDARTVQKILLHVRDVQGHLKDHEMGVSASGSRKLIGMRGGAAWPRFRKTSKK